MYPVSIMAITLHDVCRETGLSTATVSRVLNDSPLVKEATREKVLDAMKKLDYRPSSAARALSVQRTETLGVLSPYVGGGFFTDVLRGADSVAIEDRYHLMTAFSHGVTDEQSLVTSFVRERRVDALIVVNLDLPGAFLADLAQYGMPIVSVDTPAVEHGIPSVTIDNQSGAYSLMQHMLGHGHRDFVVFTGPEISYDSQGRLAGCRAAAQEAGVEIADADIHTGEFTIESGTKLMTALLDSGRKHPDAIISLNDDMAIGAMGIMRERSLSVPNDIAIVGFDDCESATVLGLTSVKVPQYQIGQEAARLALDAIKEPPATTPHVVVPCEPIIRQSCGCRPQAAPTES